MYTYTCPRCDTQYEFRNRITQRKRTCAHCGAPISVREIDRQEHEARHNRLVVALIVWGFLGFCGLIALTVLAIATVRPR